MHLEEAKRVNQEEEQQQHPIDPIRWSALYASVLLYFLFPFL